MVNKYNYSRSAIILFTLSCFLFLLGNGILGLTNDNEVEYAQAAKEMIQQNTWMTPYLFGKPLFEKPIFFFWLLRIGFILFGVSSFGARFFPAVFAALGVLAVYSFGLLGFKDEKKAFLSSVILMSSGMYIGLAKTVFTDMVFSILMLLSLLSFFWGYHTESKKRVGLLLCSILAGLAVLTKGPLGLLIPSLTIVLFLLLKKDWKFLFNKYSLWCIFIFILVTAPWYILMIKAHGNVFIQEFIHNDNIRRFFEAQHASNDTWHFYPFLIIACMFPWSLFVLASLIYLPKYLTQRENSFCVFLVCWISVIFFIFQIPHSKVANYILPIFPPVALLVGSFMYDMLFLKRRIRLVFYILLVTLLIILLLPFGLRIVLIEHSMYMVSKMLIYYLISAFFVLAILTLYFIFKNKLLKSIYSLALAIPIFLCSLPFIKENFDSYLSSREACEYLTKNYTINNTIICSKFLVRGVKYYADKDVAILDMSDKPLFSSHPIVSLNSEEKVKDFLRKQGITFCIVNKSLLEDIKRITANEFELTMLKVVGNQYIFKIEKL